MGGTDGWNAETKDYHKIIREIVGSLPHTAQPQDRCFPSNKQQPNVSSEGRIKQLNS